MANILLEVDAYKQPDTNLCWHTSAYMIWLYWQSHGGAAGPMNTMIDKYTANQTLSPQLFVTLGKKVGLKPLPIRRQHTAANLAGYLEKYGPVWSAGYWYDYPHVIVLTGVQGQSVYYNDPEEGESLSESVKWFNEKLAKQIPGCLMVMGS